MAMTDLFADNLREKIDIARELHPLGKKSLNNLSNSLGITRQGFTLMLGSENKRNTGSKARIKEEYVDKLCNKLLLTPDNFQYEFEVFNKKLKPYYKALENCSEPFVTVTWTSLNLMFWGSGLRLIGIKGEREDINFICDKKIFNATQYSSDYFTLIRSNSLLVTDLQRNFSTISGLSNKSFVQKTIEMVIETINKNNGFNQKIILAIENFNTSDSEILENIKYIKEILTGYDVAVLILGIIPKSCLDLFDAATDITCRIKNPAPVFHLPLLDSLNDDSRNKDTQSLAFPSPYRKIVFDKKYGYAFDGDNPLNCYSEAIPCLAHPRGVSFAFYCTQPPLREKPMFFFSYGERSHDRAFGVFWGIPQIDGQEGLENSKNDNSLRIFLYAAIETNKRSSGYCDIDLKCNLTLNRWYTMTISYAENNILNVYLDSKLILAEKIILTTSKTNHLSLGGFLLHHEGDIPSHKDIKYSMQGYIREFQLFNSSLTPEQVIFIEKEIRQNVTGIF